MKVGLFQEENAWVRIACPDAPVSLSHSRKGWRVTIVEDTHGMVECLDCKFFLCIFVDRFHEDRVRDLN